LCSMPASLAQQPTADLAGGIQPFQSYHGGEIDRVNLSSGQVFVHIPLISYPQRGGKLHLDFALDFNGKKYSIEKDCLGGPPCVVWWEDGDTYYTNFNFPISDWYVADEQDIRWHNTVVSVPLSGGSSKDYTLAGWETSDTAVHPGALLSGVAGKTGQQSIDGSGLFSGINFDGTCTSQCYTIDSAGIIYHPTTAILREDANGNQIQNGSVYIDTLQRQIPAPPQTPSAGNSNSSAGCTGPLPIYAVQYWKIPGSNNSTLTFTFCYAQVAINIPDLNSTVQGFSSTVSKLQSVILPNGRSWTFEYSSRNTGDAQSINYGDLTKITFPTGGTLSYTYQLITFNSGQSGSM
jgi:hypothetical protein